MVMGDLVLLESEINPVMTTAIENGLEITAVHNHILRASPLTFYMHVSGRGDPVQLANALHKALAASKTPLKPYRLRPRLRPKSLSVWPTLIALSASKARLSEAFISSL
jgi:Domain of Unknown Function (DUF1259)